MKEIIIIFCWIVIPLAVATLATAKFKREQERAFVQHTNEALSIFNRK